MKFIIPAQLLVLFRSQGYIRFENCGISYEKIKKEKESSSLERDLFRKSDFLKKMILNTLGPIALELSKQSSLRLARDQWTSTLPKVNKIKDALCFQNLILILVISEGENGEANLDAFDPSYSVSEMPEDSYLIAFTLKNGVLINNPDDPFCTATRNLGYVYGDALKNSLHPLIHAKGAFL